MTRKQQLLAELIGVTVVLAIFLFLSIMAGALSSYRW